MRHLIKFTVLFLSICIAYSAEAATYQISQEEAFLKIAADFENKEVDYYTLERFDGQEEQDVWRFFVDANPLAGWEHECYIYSIARSSSFPASLVKPSKQLLSLPPNDYKLVRYEITDHYGNNSSTPYIVKNLNNSDLTNEDNPASRTFAVILSGGYNPSSNYERYWNDCSFIYQALRKGYSIPKHNIYVIMSDGTDPAIDMLGVDGHYKSSPLDLDFDGNDDIRFAANKSNIKNVMNELNGILQANDHLFFYVIDHGGKDRNNSYINLWGYERLYDYELAEMLRPLSEKCVNINVLLGQCYSGGFIDDLEQIDCVVATACGENEVSYACQNIPYDEFVYRWTCAISKTTHDGRDVDADTNLDGSITMGEAFRYAQRYDSRPETPMFAAFLNPLISLSFDKFIKCSHDLIIRDNVNDYGQEPNLSTDIFWNSPDVWVRNEDDSIYWNEHPYYSNDHKDAYIYVNVHNYGERTYYGGEYLVISWAKASTGLTPASWSGKEFYNGYQTGHTLYGEPMDGRIAPGESKIFAVRWPLQASFLQAMDGEDFHFCLLAQVKNYPEMIAPDMTIPVYQDVIASRKVAQRNITFIPKEELSKGKAVFVRNVINYSQKYTLEILPDRNIDESLFKVSDVKMKMSSPIYKAWSSGGMKSVDIDNSTDTETMTVKLLSADSKIQDITLGGNEFDMITLKFDFNTLALKSSRETKPDYYTFHLVQRNENGDVIGGETFMVESPTLSYQPLTIESTATDHGDFLLISDVPDTYTLNWYDETGNIISNENSVTVKPSASNKTFTITALSPEGELADGSITLVPRTGVKMVTPESAVDDFIDITLYEESEYNTCMYSISSLTDGQHMLYGTIPTRQTETRINVSSMRPGLYVLTCIIDGETTFTKKFTKK